MNENNLSVRKNFGEAKQENPYKSSTEQERFAKQLDRDLERKSKTLSQSTLRRLLSDDTAKWAKSIYDQKTAQSSATNTSAQSASPSYATTKISESSNGVTGGASSIVGLSGESAGSSTDTPSVADGANLGDILYWDPESGVNGDWVVLPAPQGGGLRVLAIDGGAPFWNETESC